LKIYPDGKSLLISSFVDSGVHFYRLDLATHKLDSLGERTDISSRTSWAVPGKSLYVSRVVNGIRNIWEYSLENQALRQVSFGPGPDWSPMLDPSGHGLYFINGKAAGTLTVYRSATKQFSDVVDEIATQPTLSRDGKKLAYILEPAANKSEIWVSDLDGNHRLKLASGESLETLSWSTDAGKFVYGDTNGSQMKLYVVDADGTNVRQIPWSGQFVGFAIWEPGNQSIVLSGVNERKEEVNWRIFLDGRPAETLYQGCGMAVDISPDQKFIIGTVLWHEHPAIYQYSVADKKCTVLRAEIATYLAYFSPDGKSFLYSLAAHGETTIYRQPWRNGANVGAAVPALKLPFALREDYGGNAFMVSLDLSSVVYARPGGHDDLYLLSLK